MVLYVFGAWKTQTNRLIDCWLCSQRELPDPADPEAQHPQQHVPAGDWAQLPQPSGNTHKLAFIKKKYLPSINKSTERKKY